MTIRLRPNNPMHPDLLRDLANDLEQATGEDVEVWEVRGLFPIEVIDMFLDDAIQAAAVALAFAEWRRRHPRDDSGPRIKGVIYGPNEEVLREVPEDDE